MQQKMWFCFSSQIISKNHLLHTYCCRFVGHVMVDEWDEVAKNTGKSESAINNAAESDEKGTRKIVSAVQ